jgi:hypothetical protein
MTRRARLLGAVGLALTLSTTVGCQTWIGGMTLPSPHYLEHYPQYFPPDPDFPLEKELQTQIDYSGQLRIDDGALPGAVPPVGIVPDQKGVPAPPLAPGIPR